MAQQKYRQESQLALMAFLFITLLQGAFPDEPASRKLSTKGGSSKTGVLNFEQPDYLKIIKGSMEWYKCHTSY